MFATVVKLYRALGNPVVDMESTYRFAGAITSDVYDLIVECQGFDERFGEIDVQTLRATHADIEVSLPRGDVGRFYKNAKDFLVSAHSIAFGNIPSNYFLLEENYLSGEFPKPAGLIKVESISCFIKTLSEFAEDSKNLSLGDQPRLVFVLPPDGKAPHKTVIVPIFLEEKVINCELNHFRILESLVNSANEKKLHIEERRLVMKVAIGDVLAGVDADANRLTYLLENWQEVLKKYRHNFQAYINKFAFDEVRKKIADAEIEYASKLGGVLGDIASKLLALPVSLLALIALEKAETSFSFWIGCLALLVVTLIYLAVLVNQKLQVDRLKASYDLVFSPFFAKLATYPKPLRAALEQRRDGVNSQISTLSKTFLLFYFIAALPSVGALYQIWAKFLGPIVRFFMARL